MLCFVSQLAKKDDHSKILNLRETSSVFCTAESPVVHHDIMSFTIYNVLDLWERHGLLAFWICPMIGTSESRAPIHPSNGHVRDLIKDVHLAHLHSLPNLLPLKERPQICR